MTETTENFVEYNEDIKEHKHRIKQLENHLEIALLYNVSDEFYHTSPDFLSAVKCLGNGTSVGWTLSSLKTKARSLGYNVR